MKRVVLVPYKMGSASSKALQEGLQEQGIKCKRVRVNGNYVPKSDDLIVGWGSSQLPNWMLRAYNKQLSWLNDPTRVTIASNKLLTFQALKDKVYIPEFTIDPFIACEWQHGGNLVFARKYLSSHSGFGIEELVEENTHYPLFVKYIKKKAEYRVHVFNGKVIDVQQKKKRKDFEGEINTYIRSHNNGWVFCREDLVVPDDVKTQAVAAVEALGLTFGAVDVVWNQHQGRSYVLEVNTAPGLEGLTITNYVNAIKEFV